MSGLVRTVQGISVPSFFYGTAWKEERTEELTRVALTAGFRAIDTANQRRHYVEAAVGNAIAATLEGGRVKREDLFVQTKFTFAEGQDHRLPYDPRADVPTQVQQSLDSSLAHLRTAYVDSLILHGPSRGRGLGDADWEAWRGMEEEQWAGRARLIGVSNVSLEQLTTLFEEATAKPAFVQNRCFAHTGWDAGVRAFCDGHGIAYQGFSLLTANAREIQRPALERIAQGVGRTLAQVVFRYALQLGMIPLTGTTSETHMLEDLACFDFELTEAELETITSSTA
jgi:diketogulonate reductase-like aldo/keto reductase